MTCQNFNVIFFGAVLAAIFGVISVFCTPLPNLTGQEVKLTNHDVYVSNATDTLISAPIEMPNHLSAACRKCKEKHGGGGVFESLSPASLGLGMSPVQLGFKEAEGLLRLATLVPAETLQLLRMVTVPLINTSLGVPANLLEQLSNSSMMSLIDPTGWQLPRALHGINGSSHWFNMNHFVGLGQHSSFNLTEHFSHGGINTSLTPSLPSHGAIGSQNLISPLNLFALKTASANSTKLLPATLNPEHMLRHFDNLSKFLGARENVTVSGPPSIGAKNETHTNST